MSRIAILLFAVTLSVVVSADEAMNQWRPLWNAVQWQVAGFQVPLKIVVDEPTSIANRNGVTKEMVERAVELRNPRLICSSIESSVIS